MSPLPRRERLAEYAVKGAHLALRQVAEAPEQRIARRLAAQAAGTAFADGPRVAILTPRDWAPHVQWEGMIAQALRVRGADVHFITCGGGLEICDRVNTYEGPPVPCTTCTRYVDGSIDAHAFPRVPLRLGWEEDDPGAWPEIDAVTLAELAHVDWESIPLGAMATIPVRWFLMASSVDDDPLAGVTTRRFLRSGRRIARGIAAALDELEPKVVLLCNGLFFFEAIAWELCRQRGIDVVTYERGFIKETLVFRRGAPACLTDVSEAWAEWRETALAAEENARLDTYLDDRKLGRRTIDRYWKDPTFEAVDRSDNGRLAVLFTNLTWDSAVIGQEVAYPSIQAWLEAAILAFEKRPSDRLIVRIHPAEVKLPGKQTREPLGEFVRQRFPELPPNVRLIDADDPTSSYPLMDAADVGLVFTSTTGMELALSGTPVIVAGSTHYRGKGFTLDAESPDDFERLLGQVLEAPERVAPDVELARRYAYLFFFRAPIGSPGVVEHVPGLARITVRELQELEPGRNPDVDRICEGILNGRSFIPPPVS